jgi:hypothetical protein
MGYCDEFDVPTSRPARDYFVCANCFDDLHLKTFIKASLNARECDFCHCKGRKHDLAAPLVAVAEVIIEAVQREYQFAVDFLGWDSAEGGYLGSHWDSDDLLRDVIGLDLPKDADGRLFDVLVECLGDQEWCERDPYALREDDRLVGSWEHFCRAIKHERRYFFLREKETGHSDTSEYLSPGEVLSFIEGVVEEHSLIKPVPSGALIYRARQQKHGEVFSSPCDLGPPPVEFATKPNRMSPAGIVMFYGSEQRETAVAEIDDDPQLGIVTGTFRTNRQAHVLDLTRLPRRLGFFERQSDSDPTDRYAVAFLHRFVKSLAAKVEPGAREHIDYVPTQVVTEWFRTEFRYNGAQIDGIRYASAARASGTSLVLFATECDVVLSPRQITELAKKRATEEWMERGDHKDAWLELVRRREERTANL